MRNVAPTVALVRRSRQLLIVAFLVLMAGLFVALVGLALFVIPLSVPSNQGFDLYQFVRTALFFIGLAVAAVGMILGVRALTWKVDNDLAKATGEYLAAYFNDQYTFIRNISRLGLGYIDSVLVGPAGALVFRIVSDDGVYFNDHGKWLKRGSKNNWIPLRFNPTKECVDDIQSLRKFLASHQMSDFPVFGVVVFTGDKQAPQVTAENPVVPVCVLDNLYDTLLGNYMAKERVSGEQATGVVGLLYRE